MRTVEMDMDVYLDLLEERRNFVVEHFGWGDMPDCLWEYFIEKIGDCGVAPEYSSPKYIVDNALVNGDWGEFDNYKEEGETDEEFIERVKDEVEFIDETERIVCYSI